MNESKETLLVSVEHAEGAAGVFDVEGDGLWMTGYVETGPGTSLQGYEPGREGLNDDRWAIAGRLPEPASSCRVRDVTGEWIEATVANGVWVALIPEQPFSSHVVMFLDADGAIVPMPTPGDWERTAVPDPGEACPVCDGGEWDEVSGTESIDFGDGDLEHRERRQVVCRCCGYRIEQGVFYGPDSAAADESIDPEDARRARENWRAENFKGQLAEVLRSDLDVYGPRGGPCDILGSSTEGGSMVPIEAPDPGFVLLTTSERPWRMENAVLTALKIGTRSSPGYFVESTRKPGRVLLDPARAEVKARYRLEDLLLNVEQKWPEGRAAVTLYLDRRDREVAAEVRRAQRFEVSIPIDGEPFDWIGVRSGERWAAVCLHRETQLAVFATAVEPDEVEVERLTDLPKQLRPAPLPHFDA